MKLAPLLSQYLYTNKRLDLPGIGTFLLDNVSITDTDGNKIAESISFENNPIKTNSSLIEFISAQTGKMKALAAADLDSFLELTQQFLNIGKPFFIEGIGSLVKIRTGQFAFTSGQIMPDKMKEYSAREISTTASIEESFHEYTNGKEKTGWKKPLALLLLLAGIGLAIWGGYTVYERTSKEDNNTTQETLAADITTTTPANEDTNSTQIVTMPDTVQIVRKDSIPVQSSNTTVAGSYKFVVEVANKERGLQRYGTLKSWGLNIKMETTDSANYKLFFVLPASAADTSRILDSLSALYTPAWRKGFVEN